MKIYIFQKDFNQEFRQVELNVKTIQHNYLIHSFRRKLSYMTFQSNKLSLLDLLTADILHVYINGEDYSKIYPLDYVTDFSFFELGLTAEEQSLLNQVRNGEMAKIKTIQDTANLLIDYYSNRNSEKFRVLSQVAQLAYSDREFLKELKDYFGD